MKYFFCPLPQENNSSLARISLMDVTRTGCLKWDHMEAEKNSYSQLEDEMVNFQTGNKVTIIRWYHVCYSHEYYTILHDFQQDERLHCHQSHLNNFSPTVTSTAHLVAMIGLSYFKPITSKTNVFYNESWKLKMFWSEMFIYKAVIFFCPCKPVNLF